MKVVRIICTVVLLVVIAFLVWMFLGSVPNLTEGVVVDKTSVAARTELHSYPVGGGTSRYTQIDSHYYPASWHIRVEGISEDGTPAAEWWSIGEGLFELIRIGDYVYRDAQSGAITYLPATERGD